MRFGRPTIDLVQRVVRWRVCAGCPYRTPDLDGTGVGLASACEGRCRLFNHLPLLFEVARQADPVVGRRHGRLVELAERLTRPGGRLRRNAYAAVDAIEEVMGD